MSASRGNPRLVVRVEQETLDKAQEVFPATHGRSGGVALALRRLLHVVLDEPIPKQYGEVRRAQIVDDLEEMVRSIEAGRTSLSWVGEGLAEVRKALSEIEDPVDRLRMQSVAGRLALLSLSRKGTVFLQS